MTPSTELHQWYHQHLEQREAFRTRYLKELAETPEAQHRLQRLANQSHDERLTFVYGAKDKQHNRVILVQVMVRQFQAIAELTEQ